MISLLYPSDREVPGYSKEQVSCIFSQCVKEYNYISQFYKDIINECERDIRKAFEAGEKVSWILPVYSIWHVYSCQCIHIGSGFLSTLLRVAWL